MENLRPGRSLPAEGVRVDSLIPLEKRFLGRSTILYISKPVRAEVSSCERQLSGYLRRQGRDRSRQSEILARAAAAIFSGDCGRRGRPTTKATAAAAAEPWVGVCALVSEAQVEASAIARAPAVERMTSAAVFLLS